MLDSQLLAIRAIIARVPETSIQGQITASLIHIDKEASAAMAIFKNPDPDRSASFIDKAIGDQLARVRDLVAKARPALLTAIANWRNSQEAARVKKAALVPDAFSAEVRSVFRQMAYPAQMAFIAEAVKKDDGASVAAITEAPPILSGLTREQTDIFRGMYLDAFAPSSAAIADEMLSCVTTALNAAESFAQPIGATVRTDKPYQPIGSTPRTDNQPGVIVQAQH